MNQMTAPFPTASMDRYIPPHALLDKVIERHNLKNDAALSRFLEVAPPVISKIRHHRLLVGATLILRIHELTGLSIADIKAMLPKKGLS